MVRSDEFFNLFSNLEGSFPEIEQDNASCIKYGINQSTLNSFNYKHNLPMERVETLLLEKAKDIFLEFFYLPVTSISLPESHFNFIDVLYKSGHKAYTTMCQELGENFTVIQLYEWRVKYYNLLNNDAVDKNYWLERLSKIRAYFKQR